VLTKIDVSNNRSGLKLLLFHAALLLINKTLTEIIFSGNLIHDFQSWKFFTSNLLHRGSPLSIKMSQSEFTIMQKKDQIAELKMNELIGDIRLLLTKYDSQDGIYEEHDASIRFRSSGTHYDEHDFIRQIEDDTQWLEKLPKIPPLDKKSLVSSLQFQI
jgi:hypothetical protein